MRTTDRERPAGRSVNARAIDYTTTVVCAGFCAGLLLSWRLWYSPERLYPLAPLLPGLRVPPLVDLILVLTLLLSLSAAPLRRWATLPARMAVALAASLAMLDQSRLQPWVYEYCLFLIVLSFAQRRASGDDGHAGVLTTCRLIVVALYLWGALQKMNATFVTRTWTDFSAGFATAMAVPNTEPIGHIAWAVPSLELAVAVGLLTVRFRRIAVVAAVAMHAGILLMLVVAQENSVVWPWNAATAALAVTLFWRTKVEASMIIRGDQSLRHIVMAVAVGLLPFLSFAGLWDAYLSGALYSGNTIQAIVLVSPETARRLPEVMRANTWQQSAPMFIDLNRWSYGELNVPAYPAERVMKAVGRDVCRSHVLPDQGSLRILGRPNWRTGARSSTTYDCFTEFPRWR